MKCWTFHLTGGTPVQVGLARNPRVEHDGRVSIWHVILNDKMALYLEHFLKGNGIAVRAHADEQGPEQKAEREMAASLDENRLYRTVRCLGCLFFDPQLEEDCGYEGWGEPAIMTLMENHQKALEDVQACPLHGEGE